MTRLLTWIWMLRVLLRAGMVPLMRPDKYLRQGLAVRRHGTGPLSGLSLSAVRNPDASTRETAASTRSAACGWPSE